MTLEEEYNDRFSTLAEISINIEKELEDCFLNWEHIDRIYARPKSVSRFVQKSEKEEKNGTKKYSDPINQIQDQIGARIIVYYLDDVQKVSDHLLNYYSTIEEKDVVPESEKEFDYEGKHFILLVPKDVIPENTNERHAPSFFELQIKTLYQHAFSEASHDLAYKPNRTLSRDQNRKVAYASAQSWGADKVFSELVKELLN